MTEPAPKHDIHTVSSQISESLKLGRPHVSGSFGDVYRFTIKTSEGTSEVAVKVVKIHLPSRSLEKIEKAMRRELHVWLRLSKYPTIVPILDIVHVGSQLPAIISQWMPSGTLYTYLEQGSLTAAAKVELVTGVAEGLGHLHSENVIHGDLHPANVLIDDSGNPRLTDFGLATVVGDPELQWGPSTAGSNFNPQWRAPEVIGINGDPELPTFKSDIYSFGSVMLFVVSGDVPWKHKGPPQIVVGLAERANPASARPNKILDNHWVLIQKCWSWDPWDRPRAVEVLGSLRITGLAIEDNTLTDFTSQIFDQLKLGRPYASKSFGAVYRCTVKTSEGATEVAVKVLNDDRRRATEKLKRAMRRELDVWLRLSKYPTIVPLLGIAYVDSPFPALVSQWMSSGTLDMYLKQGTITASNKVELITGVAEGLVHLHSEHVVHGDLHPANVLIDGSGNPRLADFGLATVVGDAESQWGTTTAARELNVRWRAPEVIGIESEPERPTFGSDIYSFGGIMFLIVSGNMPWIEKKNSFHIMFELSKRLTPARPNSILDGQWNLIQSCWSWEPTARPTAAAVLQFIDQFRTENSQGRRCNFPGQGLADLTGQLVATGGWIDQSTEVNSQTSISNSPSLPKRQLALAEDLTGQIFGSIMDYVASGAFANVYRCEWRRPSGPIKVAVKVFSMNNPFGRDLRRIRRETTIWAHLVHDNIVTLYGTTEGFGPTTALVSRWFPDGTLFHLIAEQGATLTLKSKLKLLHGIASGLFYLHSFPIVHGDIQSSNIMVDLKDGEYEACLTDFGSSHVLGGLFKDQMDEESTVWPGAIRWTAPELLSQPSGFELTTQSDMYSYGCVMFHLLTLVIPWYGMKEHNVILKIIGGETIPRPGIREATSDVTDARWNQMAQFWSVDPSARPSAFMAMNFVKSELGTVTDDDSHQNASSYVVRAKPISTSVFSSGVQRQAGMLTTPLLQSRTLDPSRKTFLSRPRKHHLLPTVSSLKLVGPLNVLLFGEAGVGKSAIIELIMGCNDAQTSPGPAISHEVSLGGRRFRFWEVASIDSMGFLRTIVAKWRLKRWYKKLYKDDGVYLLLYCMRGSRAQRALIRDYKFFTDIVGSTAGRVPVAAVVTYLEDYPKDMDGWWAKNKDNLERLGMRFTAHACITSLPDDPDASPSMRARRHRSEQAIRSLIHCSSPALTLKL